MNLELLRSSFALVKPHARQLVDVFYATLFDRHPEVAPLFEGADMAAQKRHLFAALATVVRDLDRPELDPYLSHLGRRHDLRGVRPEHYTAVADALLFALAQVAGPAWNEAVALAWQQALAVLTGKMLPRDLPCSAGIDPAL